MMKKLALVSTLIALPLNAFAVDNVGGCGLGSKLMAGNQGIVPQVIAITTNGSSGNQTFGISTGTLGCSQDGVVHSNWKTASFINSNMNRLAKDISVGQGESVEALSSLLSVDSADQEAFKTALKANFSSIYTSSEVTAEDVAKNIQTVLSSNASLAKYASLV